MAVDTNIVNILGAGSGVDVKSLAENLVAAERAPKQQLIESKIARSEAKISGYAAMMAAMSGFKTAVDALDTKNELASVKLASNSSAVVPTVTGNPALANHQIDVVQLAAAQRSISAGFALPATPLNTPSAAMTLSLSINGGASSTINVDAGSDTPEGVVSAINAANAGVTAELVDTGDPEGTGERYVILVRGEEGADQNFTLSGSNGMTFTTVPGFGADDAKVVVNGVTVIRSTNQLTDVIPGLRLDLAQTTAGSSILVQVARDSDALKSKVQALVDSYNQMISDFKILTGPKSDDPEDVYSGSLSGESLVRSVTSQIRSVLFGESDTATDSVSTFRQLGISVDRDGVMSLDTDTFDEAVATQFDDLAEALAGRKVVDDELQYGLSASLSNRLRDLMSPTGVVMTQSNTAETLVTRYNEDLAKLETRMEGILARYTKQFAAMESLVGQMTSLRESLKSQFENMSAMYSNK
ncbi:FliD Flagellar capping protein [Burkholderiales bacterium]